MRKQGLVLILLLSMLLGLFGCGKKSPGGEWITKRVQYDVSIKSPDPDLDWWVQNIEGSSRESFVRDVMQAVYSGKVKAWDVFHQEMSVDQVKAIGFRVDTLTFERTYPPYELYDTVVRKDLNLGEITRFRFLESWKMDPATLRISKEVSGICPLLENYAPDGTLRGYMPMFWVYFDPSYPAAFKVSGS